MRRSRIARGSTCYGARKTCRACKGRIDDVGPISFRGLCHSCGVIHMVAHSLGMLHLHYTDETINGLILGSYTGPVIKAA